MLPREAQVELVAAQLVGRPLRIHLPDFDVLVEAGDVVDEVEMERPGAGHFDRRLRRVAERRSGRPPVRCLSLSGFVARQQAAGVEVHPQPHVVEDFQRIDARRSSARPSISTSPLPAAESPAPARRRRSDPAETGPRSACTAASSSSRRSVVSITRSSSGPGSRMSLRIVILPGNSPRWIAPISPRSGRKFLSNCSCAPCGASRMIASRGGVSDCCRGVGKDQQREVREIDPAVVVPLVVVEHEHHRAGFVLDHLRRPRLRPVIGAENRRRAPADTW